MCRRLIGCVFVCAALSVGLRGPGGDGEAEEGAHRGSEGDQKAAGEENVQDPPRSADCTSCGLYVLPVDFLLLSLLFRSSWWSLRGFTISWRRSSVKSTR